MVFVHDSEYEYGYGSESCIFVLLAVSNLGMRFLGFDSITQRFWKQLFIMSTCFENQCINYDYEIWNKGYMDGETMQFEFVWWGPWKPADVILFLTLRRNLSTKHNSITNNEGLLANVINNSMEQDMRNFYIINKPIWAGILNCAEVD